MKFCRKMEVMEMRLSTVVLTSTIKIILSILKMKGYFNTIPSTRDGRMRKVSYLAPKLIEQWRNT